jgi:hypothetical protein
MYTRWCCVSSSSWMRLFASRSCSSGDLKEVAGVMESDADREIHCATIDRVWQGAL